MDKIKADGKGRDHDCLIGISGGIDSSYVTYLAVEKLGLRPLIFHVDAGWNSQEAVNNIERLIDGLKLTLYTEVVNWLEMKDLQLAFFKAQVPHLDTPQDHVFFASLYNFAAKNKVKYIITGANYSTECVREPLEWHYHASDLRQLKDIHRRFGTRPLNTFPTADIFKYKLYYRFLKGVRVVKPLNYVPYLKEAAMQELVDKFGWQRYAHKHYESRFTRFFEGYWLPRKFGYDKRRAHFSSLILTRQMTRDEALRRIAQPAYDEEIDGPGLRLRGQEAGPHRPRAPGHHGRREQDLPRLQVPDAADQLRHEGPAALGPAKGDDPVIAIVDYGLGNVKAFANVYSQSNIAFTLAKRADELLAADKIILPGVGAFDQAMLRLEQSGLRETLDELVVKRRVPVLGVCVGMQMLARFQRGRPPAGPGLDRRGGPAVQARGSRGFHAGSPYGLERHPARPGERVAVGARSGRPFLFSPFLLLPKPSARGRHRRFRLLWGVRLRGEFRERLRGPIPSRKKPSVGHPAAPEFRRDLTMLRPRIIPCLLVQNKGLVKTVEFADPRYVGDPINAVRIFNEKEVDEIMVLDIDATAESREPDFVMIENLAQECRMPLCFGGGVKTSAQIQRIIQMGVEKVAIGSAAVENPGLIGEAAERVGNQSIVVVLDVRKRSRDRGYEVWIHNGRKADRAEPAGDGPGHGKARRGRDRAQRHRPGRGHGRIRSRPGAADPGPHRPAAHGPRGGRLAGRYRPAHRRVRGHRRRRGEPVRLQGRLQGRPHQLSQPKRKAQDYRRNVRRRRVRSRGGGKSLTMFKDKVLLITGGTGTFGHAVLKRFLDTEIAEIRIFSRDEKKQDEMRNALRNPKVKFYLGDVRDYDSLLPAMRGADLVFHAAALKQVPSCEFFPLEAIRTNSLGAHNVMKAAAACRVRNLIALSTDKAVYPINAMGMSKALMEKIMIANARDRAGTETVLCGTRYGNVMGSRGSVIPLFIGQILAGEPLTITDPNMTRFMMSIDEAVELVLYAFRHGKPGDIFVRKSPAATIDTLAKALQKLFRREAEIRIIGTRHGEKLYETLLTREERSRAEDRKDYFRIPADGRGLDYACFYSEGERDVSGLDDYTSHNTTRLDEARMMERLRSLDFVREALKAGRTWEPGPY